MHFLITGHTGFKGAWLTLLLRERGHKISGLSLDPKENSLFQRAEIGRFLERDLRCDILDSRKLEKCFKEIQPDVVIHLAAQSLVLESYRNPGLTFETNVIGTLNVINASKVIADLKAQLIVTTDKVYKNQDNVSGYAEEDPLGGKDPYSASKAMADIGAQSLLSSFSNPPSAIARAGNVVGGGDSGVDRLIPDLVNSYSLGVVPKLRAPDSIRPWQHVLDCLNGYLVLVEALTDGMASGEWNFGPAIGENKSVADVADIAGAMWGVKTNWEISSDSLQKEKESRVLILDSTKARQNLGWSEKLSFEESVEWTVRWYKNVSEGSSPLQETLADIKRFESR